MSCNQLNQRDRMYLFYLLQSGLSHREIKERESSLPLTFAHP